jgi:hypothetical protein
MYGKFSPAGTGPSASNICPKIGDVGERRHDRQLAEAETKYMAAVFRLLKAMNAFDGSAFPLEPGDRSHPVPWTRKHVAIAQALEAGRRDVLRTRRDWDVLRREWQPPHG